MGASGDESGDGVGVCSRRGSILQRSLSDQLQGMDVGESNESLCYIFWSSFLFSPEATHECCVWRDGTIVKRRGVCRMGTRV